MDMVVELLLMTGRSLQVMMMLVPEAWEKNAGMPIISVPSMSIIPGSRGAMGRTASIPLQMELI
jgi:glutamate synthase domain-containing protein 1